MAPRSSITKRWLLNSFGIIVVIMVAMVIGVSAAMHSFYYNSASQYIRTRAAAVSARLESAAADAGSDFNARLYELVQDFEYRAPHRADGHRQRRDGVPYLQRVFAAGYRHARPGRLENKRRYRLLYRAMGRPENYGCDRAFLPFGRRACWGCGMWSPCRPSTGS